MTRSKSLTVAGDDVPTYRVSRGQKIGDLALALVVGPVAAASFAFLSVLFGLIVARLMGVQEMPNLWVAGIMGGGLFTALVLYSPRPQWWWAIRLEPDAVVLQGPVWKRRLPYESLRLLRSGGPERWESGSHQGAGSIPLVIEGTMPTATIYLLPGLAEECLLKLRQRCAHAAAVDSKGRSYLPSQASEVPEARRRLARFWRASGRVALVMGLLLFFPSIAVLFSSALGQTEQLTGALESLIAGVSLVFFGRGMLQKARRFDRPNRG